MYRRRGRSLGIQLSLRIGLLSLLTLSSIVVSVLVGTVLTLVIAHREVHDQSLQAAGRFDRFLNTIETDLVAVADALPQVNDPNLTLRDVLARHPEIFTIRWLATDGAILAERQRVGQADSATITSQPWLTTIQADETYWGAVDSSAYGVPFMEVAVPVWDRSQNTLHSTLLVELDLTALWNAVSSVRVGETGYAYLVDGEGQLLAYRDLALVRSDRTLQARIGKTPQEVEEDGETFLSSTHIGLNNQRVISSGTTLERLGWVAVVEQSLNEALSDFYNELTALVLMLAVTLLMIFNSVWFTRRQIVRPLLQLRDSVESFRVGNLSERMPVTGYADDEIGRLVDTFNRMADNIQRRTQDLIKANAIARESARLKSEFMAVMSHELRTPMNAVLGFTSLMLEGMSGKIDDDARHMLTRIENNGKRLLGIINEILDISKIETGRLELVSIPFSPYDLSQQWQDQMTVLAAEFKEKKLTYSAEIDPTLPPQLSGDPDRITQIANNLLSNAFKFTDKGHITLISRWEGKSWIIQVRDTGVGIPPHAHDLIFDAFRQVDGSTIRRHGGTGMGLTIVRNLCTLMGGQIKVDSTLGEGSLFTVILPMLMPETAPMPVLQRE